jgi:UDP-glucose 4-epimerase
MVVSGLGAVSLRGGVHVKVLASERSTTIGAILGDLHRISRRRPPVVLGTSVNVRFQVSDLRLRSVVWPPTSGLARTPLMAGMSATMADVGHQLRVHPSPE